MRLLTSPWGRLSTTIAVICATACSNPSWAAPEAKVWSTVQTQKQPLLDTLKELVAIESGSSDREGLDRISQLILDRLRELGGNVEFIENWAQPTT